MTKVLDNPTLESKTECSGTAPTSGGKVCVLCDERETMRCYVIVGNDRPAGTSM